MKNRSISGSAADEVAVSQVAGDDAGVVGAVPGQRGWASQEGHPVPTPLGARLAGRAVEEQLRLGRVAQQPLVDRPPPRAAGLAAVGGARTPRRICQRMKAISARR